ncbi:MAG: alpha-galactosidase [Streptomyces sp.]|nr:alpha-galactosidase [Streptomyces sp.]
MNTHAGRERPRLLGRVPASPAALVAALAGLLLSVVVPLVFLGGAQPAAALGNGLALTPQMGFNDWNAYGCNVSESLIKSTAQAMHTDGMQAAGYQYVNIDDCWLTKSRDSSGHLVPDPAKFPDGIKGTADYVHSLGLKLGIYEDAGLQTCAGYPGSLGHETTDAQSFASWGVDYLKYDNCYAGPGCSLNSCPNGTETPAQTRYTAMRDALASTGRPILFSLCNWGQENVWTWGANVGNSWRTTGDINASYSSMLSIFHSNVGLASYAGPGHWNDPDMLEIGNGSLTTTENQSEFSLWAEMAAPLIAGTNIASASSATLATYTNTRVIAVDQDSLGRQGTMVSSSGGLDVLAKPLANGDVSVALFNETGSTATISTTAAAVGTSGASSYSLTNLWSGATSTTTGTISASVPAHGTVMYRVSSGSTTTGGTTTGGTTTGGTTGGTTTGGTTTSGGTTGGTGGGACSAAYSTTNSWSGGFQGQVTVTAGNAAVSGWTVKWTLDSGQTVTQVWNGTLTTSGSNVTVTNASYNGSLAAGGSTTFGFLANGTPSTPTLTCTSA